MQASAPRWLYAEDGYFPVPAPMGPGRLERADMLTFTL